MFDVTLAAPGAKRAAAKLEKMSASMEGEIDAAMNETLTELVQTELVGMSHYPYPPRGSKYVRTGTLGAGWGLERGGSMRYSVVNPTSYLRFVVGDSNKQGQARIHRNRWWLARNRIDKYVPDRVTKRILERIQARWDSIPSTWRDA